MAAPAGGLTARLAWDDLLAAPGGGPGPITNNKAYPYVPNGGGRQPTYRVADLSNPILAGMGEAGDEKGQRRGACGASPLPCP